MTYQIVYDLDYSGLLEIVKNLEQRFAQGLDTHGSYLQEAVQLGGEYAAQEWLNISATKFKHSQGGYARGIVDGIEYPYQGDLLHYRIENKADHAKILEEGFEPFDLKKMLQTSDKIRISKDGKKYLIIPFEHGTPGSKSKRAMPEDVYSAASKLKHSYKSETVKTGSIRGATSQQDADLLQKYNPKRIQRNTYEWGERLKYVNGVELEDKSIYKNMVRFQANPNLAREKLDLGKFGYKHGTNETSNGRNYSIYMTFRVMMEDAQGWMHPGLKGMYILRETFDKVKQPVLKILGAAAKKDLKRVLPNVN